MKKISTFLIAFMLFVTTIVAQETNNLILSGGATLSSKTVGENFEVGKIFGKNTVTLVTQSSDDQFDIRKTYAGFKYYRTRALSPTVDVFGNAALLVGINRGADLLFKPGIGANLKLTRNLYLQETLSTPIGENTQLFRPTRLEALTQLVLRFND